MMMFDISDVIDYDRHLNGNQDYNLDDFHELDSDYFVGNIVVRRKQMVEGN